LLRALITGNYNSTEDIQNIKTLINQEDLLNTPLDGKTPLHLAIISGNTDKIGAILEYGLAKFNEDDNIFTDKSIDNILTTLYTIKTIKPDVVKFLMDKIIRHGTMYESHDIGQIIRFEFKGEVPPEIQKVHSEIKQHYETRLREIRAQEAQPAQSAPKRSFFEYLGVVKKTGS